MINFESKNLGTWFYYNPDNEDQGGVCLRELSTDEHQRIEQLTSKTKKKFKHGNPYDDTKVDEKLASKLRWDFCIVDWKGTSLDGQECECTSENKVKLMKVIDFVKFVVDNMLDLTDSNESLAKARLKNSGSSSSGESKSQTAKPV